MALVSMLEITQPNFYQPVLRSLVGHWPSFLWGLSRAPTITLLPKIHIPPSSEYFPCHPVRKRSKWLLDLI